MCQTCKLKRLTSPRFAIIPKTTSPRFTIIPKTKRYYSHTRMSIRKSLWDQAAGKKLEKKPGVPWNRKKLSNPESLETTAKENQNSSARAGGRASKQSLKQRQQQRGLQKLWQMKQPCSIKSRSEQQHARGPKAAGASRQAAAEELPATWPPCQRSCANPPGCANLPAKKPQDSSDKCPNVCGRRWDNAIVTTPVSLH